MVGTVELPHYPQWADIVPSALAPANPRSYKLSRCFLPPEHRHIFCNHLLFQKKNSVVSRLLSGDCSSELLHSQRHAGSLWFLVFLGFSQCTRIYYVPGSIQILCAYSAGNRSVYGVVYGSPAAMEQ